MTCRYGCSYIHVLALQLCKHDKMSHWQVKDLLDLTKLPCAQARLTGALQAAQHPLIAGSQKPCVSCRSVPYESGFAVQRCFWKTLQVLTGISLFESTDLSQEGNAFGCEAFRHVVGARIIDKHMQRSLLLPVRNRKSSDAGQVIQLQLWAYLHLSFWKGLPAETTVCGEF